MDRLSKDRVKSQKAGGWASGKRVSSDPCLLNAGALIRPTCRARPSRPLVPAYQGGGAQALVLGRDRCHCRVSDSRRSTSRRWHRSVVGVIAVALPAATPALKASSTGRSCVSRSTNAPRKLSPAPTLWTSVSTWGAGSAQQCSAPGPAEPAVGGFLPWKAAGRRLRRGSVRHIPRTCCRPMWRRRRSGSAGCRGRRRNAFPAHVGWV